MVYRKRSIAVRVCDRVHASLVFASVAVGHISKAPDTPSHSPVSQLLVFTLVALVAGIFAYELVAVKPDWCVSSRGDRAMPPGGCRTPCLSGTRAPPVKAVSRTTRWCIFHTLKKVLRHRFRWALRSQSLEKHVSCYPMLAHDPSRVFISLLEVHNVPHPPSLVQG